MLNTFELSQQAAPFKVLVLSDEQNSQLLAKLPRWEHAWRLQRERGNNKGQFMEAVKTELTRLLGPAPEAEFRGCWDALALEICVAWQGSRSGHFGWIVYT